MAHTGKYAVGLSYFFIIQHIIVIIWVPPMIFIRTPKIDISKLSKLFQLSLFDILKNYLKYKHAFNVN